MIGHHQPHVPKAYFSMASLNKQHRRAQRAKVKAKQTRLQRAAASNTFRSDYDHFDYEPPCLDEMFCDACSVEFSVEQGEFGYFMKAVIDDDDVYLTETRASDDPCLQTPPAQKPLHR